MNSKYDKDPFYMDIDKLAFIGDAVFELFIRKSIVNNFSSLSIGDINNIKVKNVCCEAQAEFFKLLRPFLDEKEIAIYKRGRNSKVGNAPSRVSPYTYKVATGVEVLFGYLYLSNREDRIIDLLGHLNIE